MFARIADPAGVARRLREIVPAVNIEGPDDSWRRAIVAVQHGSERRTLTLTHDPTYYTGEDWKSQMDGMQGFLSQFPNSKRKQIAVLLPSTFQFALGVLVDPDLDDEHDARLRVLFEIANMLDGVLFTPTMLRDAQGRILVSLRGEHEEDSDAAWPRVVASVSVPATTGRNTAGSKAVPNAESATVERVARRALALAAVTGRAMLEQGVTITPRLGGPFQWAFDLFANTERQRQELLRWIESIGIGDELEPWEWQVLQRPVGKLDGRMQIDSTWRLEGLAILAWALERYDIPPLDELVKCEELWSSLGLLNVAASKALLSKPKLRSQEQIKAIRKRQLTIHWRLRDFAIRKNVIDFAEFARTSWFGPLDVSEIPLIDGDLAIGGMRLDLAPKGVFDLCLSIAQERHQAANWMIEGPTLYSEASIGT